MIFNDCLAKNKELLKNYTKFWDVVKHEIKIINGSKETNYRKDYIKFKFESNDELPLKEPLIFYEMHIFVGFVFREDDILYLEFLFRQNFVCKRNVKKEIWCK